MTQDLIFEDRQANLYHLQPKENVIQLECGSIHSLARTSLNRLFSCGNGSTFALGHGNKDTCRTFKQIQFFNGQEDSQLSGVSIKTISCGLVHSGCLLNDGSVYQWGTCGDYQYIGKDSKNPKEFLQKSIC